MKLTASTMTTASISMRTNSLTELDTARGWSCTCTSLMPAGRPSSISAVAALQRLAQRDDVAALGHRDAQRDHFLALVAHLDRRRVDVAALDLGDVAQAQLVARGCRGSAWRAVAPPPRTGRPRAPAPRPAASAPRRRDSTAFCCAQLRQHLVEVQPELRQALLRDLDVELLVLHAEQFDLGHVRHAQQLLAHVVGEGLELGVAEAARPPARRSRRRRRRSRR